MAGEDVKYTISAQDLSGPALDSANANLDRFAAHTESGLSKIQQHWMGYSATVYAAYEVMSKGWQMAKAGADFEEQKGILDNLSRKYSSTSDSIVKAMETASDGLIAKSDLMQIALGGISKGLNPEQLTNLADAARILGDAAGRDATTALRDLSEALETGRAKGLKPYLGTSMDLATAFGSLESKMTEAEKAQAMYGLTMITATKLQKEQTKEVDDAADRIERLEAKWKNLKTTAELAAKSIFVGLFTSEGWMTGALAMSGLEAPEGPAPAEKTPAEKAQLDKVAAAYQAQIDGLRKILAARKDDKDLAKEAAQAERDYLDKVEAVARAAEMANKQTEENLKWFEVYEKEKQRAKEQAARDAIQLGQSAIRADIEARKAGDDLIVKMVEDRERAIQLVLAYSLERQKQQYDDYWSMIFQTTNDSGDMSAGMGMFAANAKGIADIYSGKDEFTEQENRAYEHYMSLKELYWYDYENRVEVANAFRDYETMVEENQMARRVQIADNGFGMMSGLAKAFYDASGQQNEAAFKAYQAFAIAKAVIDTYKAAAAAWSAGWDSGVTAYDKAALAAAMMALAIGTGLAQVAMIASARPGGSSAGSVGGGSAGGYSYVQPTESSWKQAETPTRAAPIVNINVYGDVLNNHDELARKIVEPLQRAWEDGVR